MNMVALLDFALVARHGGFGAASRFSGRSKATLARRVADLEKGLAVRLFERGNEGVRLTDAGSELLSRVTGPFKEIEEAREAVRRGDGRLQGRLRISAAVVFAHAHLVRIGATFSRTHPEVQLEIVADDRMVDMVEDDFYNVIRANPDPTEQLIGKCIVRTDRVAVAAPDISIPDEDSAAGLIFRSAERPVASWRLLTEVGPRNILLRPTMKLSTLSMIREAALHGAGAALLPRRLVEDDLSTGRLSCWGIQAGVQT